MCGVNFAEPLTQDGVHLLIARCSGEGDNAVFLKIAQDALSGPLQDELDIRLCRLRRRMEEWRGSTSVRDFGLHRYEYAVEKQGVEMRVEAEVGRGPLDDGDGADSAVRELPPVPRTHPPATHGRGRETKLSTYEGPPDPIMYIFPMPAHLRITALAGLVLLASCGEENSPSPAGEEGIPVVQNIRVAYDTATGTAKVQWSPVKHSLVSDYLIYRDSGLEAPVAGPSIARTADTLFADTLWESDPGHAPGNRLAYADSARRPFTWRVRARLKTQEIGGFLNSVSALTLSPAWIRTAATINRANSRSDTATPNDTLTMVLTYTNPLRAIRTIRWYRSDMAQAFHTVNPARNQGFDTVPVTVGTGPGPTLRAVLTDEKGVDAETVFRTPVIDDQPRVSLTSSQNVIYLGDTLTLRVAATDLGRLVSREWSIGAGAPFVPGAKADTTFPMQVYALKGPVVCSVRMTDEDGNAVTVVVEIKVIPWRRLKPIPTYRNMAFSAVAIAGKIYVMGGDERAGSTEVYDAPSDTWVRKATMRHPRYGHEAIVYGKEILVAGGWDFDQHPILASEFYNPETDSWREGPPLNEPRAWFGLAVQGGRVHALEGRSTEGTTGGNQSLESYDSTSGKWSLTVLPGMPGRSHFSAVTIGDTCYTVGGVFEDIFWWKYSKDVWKYHFASSAVTQGALLPFFPYSRATAVFGEWILLAGGDSFNDDGPRGFDRFEALDPRTGRVQELPPSPPVSYARLVVIDRTVYLVGGQDRTPHNQDRWDNSTLTAFTMPRDSLLAEP